jgi:hypothetical protein
VSAPAWLRCPNQPPCPHPGPAHDIYELGDPYPTCCEPGCPCGHPGTAVVRRLADGTVVVDQADPVIRVTNELLRDLPRTTWDGDVLILDTAGRHRYEYLRPDPNHPGTSIFGRLQEGTTP